MSDIDKKIAELLEYEKHNPRQFNKLGGAPPSPTPSQHNALITLIISLCHKLKIDAIPSYIRSLLQYITQPYYIAYNYINDKYIYFDGKTLQYRSALAFIIDSTCGGPLYTDKDGNPIETPPDKNPHDNYKNSHDSMNKSSASSSTSKSTSGSSSASNNDTNLNNNNIYHTNRPLLPSLYRLFHYIISLPRSFMDKYPMTSTFITILLYTLYITYDYETDVLHTPFYPVAEPLSDKGKKILNGRKIRKMLGGRTFSQYQTDKIAYGERPPTRQSFEQYYGPFIDEYEFNNIYYSHDNTHIIIKDKTPPLPSPQDYIDMQNAILTEAKEYFLDQYHDEVLKSQLNKVDINNRLMSLNMDLRDGEVLPPGQQHTREYKPYQRGLRSVEMDLGDTITSSDFDKYVYKNDHPDLPGVTDYDLEDHVTGIFNEDDYTDDDTLREEYNEYFNKRDKEQYHFKNTSRHPKNPGPQRSIDNKTKDSMYRDWERHFGGAFQDDEQWIDINDPKRTHGKLPEGYQAMTQKQKEEYNAMVKEKPGSRH